MKPFNGPQRQGGWFVAAAMIGSTLLSINESRKARKLQRSAQGRANQIAEQELELSRNQDARSQQLFDRYMETYAPLEDQLIENIDKGLDKDEMMGRMTGDVRTAHGLADATMERDMARYGINPADGKYMEAKRRGGLSLAKDIVGAREGSRRYVDEEKFRRLGAVASLGRNLPSTAGAFAGSAQAGLGSVRAGFEQRAGHYGGIAQQGGQAAGQGLMEIARWADGQDWGSGGSVAQPGTGQHPDDYRMLMGNSG